MRHAIIRTAALGAVLSLGACDLTSLGKKDSEVTQPKTEATVVGIWRSNIPVTTTTPPTDIKVTMQVDAGHTMIMSQRVATGQPSPYDFVEIAKEEWTWEVVEGKMNSTKTACVYKNPETMQETGEPCREPKTRSADINVKGSAWTIIEAGQPIVFRKD